MIVPTLRFAAALEMLTAPELVEALDNNRVCPPDWLNPTSPVPELRLVTVTAVVAEFEMSTLPLVLSAATSDDDISNGLTFPMPDIAV